MDNYGRIQVGAVVDAIVADAAYIASRPDSSSWVLLTGGASIGWSYDGSVFTPPPPEPEPEPVPSPVISRLAFRNRFTFAEKQGIYTAAETSVDIRIFLDDIASAADIDLTDPQTIAGVQSLEDSGLITSGRGAEILAP
tara:strand:+ start:275 stop:691 length:417 start_codon:yes stop_codon:yes gene_type:complete